VVIKIYFPGNTFLKMNFPSASVLINVYNIESFGVNNAITASDTGMLWSLSITEPVTVNDWANEEQAKNMLTKR
jgi:hypothetical protein